MYDSSVLSLSPFCRQAEQLYRNPELLDSHNSRKSFLRFLISRSVRLEIQYLNNWNSPKTSRDLNPEGNLAFRRCFEVVSIGLRSLLRFFEKIYAFFLVFHLCSTRFCCHLQRFADVSFSSFDLLLEDETLIRISNAGTSFCVHSLLMVIGVLLATKPDFSALERISLIGGDTDRFVGC